MASYKSVASREADASLPLSGGAGGGAAAAKPGGGLAALLFSKASIAAALVAVAVIATAAALSAPRAAGGGGGGSGAAQTLKAVAVLANGTISGTVTFTQLASGGPVTIAVVVSGSSSELRDNANGHGFVSAALARARKRIACANARVHCARR
jgi:hypothetical protein